MIAGDDSVKKDLAKGVYSLLAMPEDQSKFVYRLSADIAELLYPFQAFSLANVGASLEWWKAHVSWAKVPAP